MNSETEELIIKAAETFRLDVNLIRAIIQVESNWNTWAVRYEPSYKYLYFPRELANQLRITEITMETLQKMSFGLMQVLGAVAMELGLTQNPAMLTDPAIGIFYGCKKLRQLFDKYADESDVISAYNQGSARKTEGGLYQNTVYVDRVHAALIGLRKLPN